MQNTLTIEYTDDLLFTLGVSDKEFPSKRNFCLRLNFMKSVKFLRDKLPN
jgi:hypothetical protein